MVYTASHNYLQVFGSYLSEGESDIWTFGLRFGEGSFLMGSGSAPEGDEEDEILDDIEADLTTWWNANQALFAGNVRFEGFKFNGVDTAGRYLNQSRTVVRDLAVPLPGAGGTMLPPQVSAAVTFRTIAARGLAARGRIYLPPFGASQSDLNGRLTTASRDAVATSTAQLLTDLSNWVGLDSLLDPGRVCVMSKVGAGATRRVNRVDVGDVFDTIRSRTSALTEFRSPEVVVTS